MKGKKIKRLSCPEHLFTDIFLQALLDPTADNEITTEPKRKEKTSLHPTDSTGKLHTQLSKQHHLPGT